MGSKKNIGGQEKDMPFGVLLLCVLLVQKDIGVFVSLFGFRPGLWFPASVFSRPTLYDGFTGDVSRGAVHGFWVGCALMRKAGMEQADIIPP